MQVLHRPRTRKVQCAFEADIHVDMPPNRQLAWTGLKPEIPAVGTKVEGGKVIGFTAVESDDVEGTVGMAWLHVQVALPDGSSICEPPSWVGL